jgi:hypothetical protein
MHTISAYDYDTVGQLHEDRNARVSHARRRMDGAADGDPLPPKTLEEPSPSPKRTTRVRHEYAIMRSLIMAGVPRVSCLETSQQCWFRMEDGDMRGRPQLMSSSGWH